MGEQEDDEQVRSLNATCPHCRGPLSEVTTPKDRYYRCLVGHRFTERELFRDHAGAQERVLWSAVVALEEAALLAREAAARRPTGSAMLERGAEDKERQARFIRGVLDELVPFALDD